MSETCFVDTNVFVRYLTGDDEKKAEAVKKLLLKARDGKIALVTNEIVIAELAWVLKSFYEQPDEVIAELLEAILNTEGLKVENSDILREGIKVYRGRNIDFIDAYIVVSMRKKGIKRLCSFDKKHMGKFEDITLVTP